MYMSIVYNNVQSMDEIRKYSCVFLIDLFYPEVPNMLVHFVMLKAPGLTSNLQSNIWIRGKTTIHI